MQNPSTSKNTKAKSSFNTTTLFVRTGGEIFLSRAKFKDVNRIISAKNFEDGTELALLLIPGDVYRLRSKQLLEIGKCFVLGDETTKVSYLQVNPQGSLVEHKLIDTNVGFAQLNFTQTLSGDIYNKVIEVLTKGEHLINITVNEPFTIRNVSHAPGAHLGKGMLLHKVIFDYVDGVMVINEVKPLTVKAATELLKVGLGNNEFLLRQLLRDSKSLQVAFSDSIDNIHYVSLSAMLSKALPEAVLTRKGEWYSVAVNLAHYK